MHLDTTSKRLQVKLDVAITTTQPSIVATWVDLANSGPTPGATVVSTNSTTQVDIVTPPANNVQRVVSEITAHNLDTVAVTFIFSYKDGATVTEFHRALILPNQTLTYTDKYGWVIAQQVSPANYPFFQGLTVPRNFTLLDTPGTLLQLNATTSQLNQLVFVGDSLTFGSGGSVPYSSVVSPIFTFTKTNLGVGGQTMDTIRQNGPAYDLYHCPQAGRNIIMLWAGTTDVAFNSFGVVATLQNMQAFCLARRRNGWKVIIGTMISRGDTTPTDNNKDSLNAQLRYYWPDFADGLADFAAEPLLGANGAWSNSTYFNTDKVHCKDAGYTLAAAIATKAIDVLSNQVGGWKASFRAHKNGTNQTGVVTATWTKLTFGTAAFNQGQFYSPSNSQFYPPIGPFRISAKVHIVAGLVIGSTGLLSIYKNGAQLATTATYVDNTSYCVLDVEVTELAVSGDVYEVYVYCDGAGNKTIDGSIASTYVNGESL